MQRNNLNYLLFILLALFWSGSFLGIKITDAYCPALFNGLIRVTISQVFITALFLMLRKPLLAPWSTCWRLWIVGIFSQGLPLAFLFYGEKSIAPALASIINSTVAIWAFIIGFIFLRQQRELNSNKIMGLILGFLGIICIFWPILHNSSERSTWIGILSVFGMAISYAIGALINQYLGSTKTRPSFYVNLWQQQWGSIFLFFILSTVLESWRPLTLNVASFWLAELYLGLFSTAIAFIIYYQLIWSWDAVRASSVMYLVPLLAILWDYLFLHSVPVFSELIGIFTILIGVALIQLPPEMIKNKMALLKFKDLFRKFCSS